MNGVSRSKRTDPKHIRAARRVASARASLRISEQAPRRGYFHPAPARQVREFLETLGPLAVYGLKEIILARAEGKGFCFGRYEAPGYIWLFEQPFGPWRMAGRISAEMEELFRNSGAEVESDAGGIATIIGWPGETLGQFLLREILVHEIGHHVLQFHKGKRMAPVARTRDHEAFARLFVHRQIASE
jgi:hypothetical protein